MVEMEAVPIVGIGARKPHDAAHMEQRAELTHRDPLSFAVALAMKQRAEDRLRSKDPGVEACDVRAEPHRWITDSAERRCILRHRLDNEGSAWQILEGALLAERANRAIHEPRIVAPEIVLAVADFRRFTRATVFENDIGGRREALPEFAAFGFMIIERAAF